MRKEFVAVWAKRAVAEITAEDVLQIVRSVKQRGAPSHARNLLGYVRRFFDWGIEQHAYGVKVNPMCRAEAGPSGWRETRARTHPDG